MDAGTVKTFLENGVIFMKGKIDHLIAVNVTNFLAKIKSEARKEKIYLIIDSAGGDFYASMEIFHELKSCGLHVVTVAFGRAGSGALLILQAGDVRLATAKSVLSFHNARHFVKEGIYSAIDFTCLADDARKDDAVQLLIYGDRVRPIRTLHRLFNEEARLNPFGAEKIKLIDEVIPHPASIEELISFLETKQPPNA